MADDDFKLRVTAVHPNGRRTYDPVSKRCLIERCLQPGASVAQLALDHGVNANLLWKWIRRHRLARQEMAVIGSPCPQTFIPVEIEKAATEVVSKQGKMLDFRSHEADPSVRKSGESGALISPVRLSASLPNGVKVTFRLGDANALPAIIGALCDVQAGK